MQKSTMGANWGAEVVRLRQLSAPENYSGKCTLVKYDNSGSIRASVRQTDVAALRIPPEGRTQSRGKVFVHKLPPLRLPIFPPRPIYFARNQTLLLTQTYFPNELVKWSELP